MFRCNHHHQGAHYMRLLKLLLLKQSIKLVNQYTLFWLIWWCGCIYIILVNLVVWLHIYYFG